MSNDFTATNRLALGHGLPPLEAFEAAERDGWISSRTLHTSSGQVLRLFNYTKECQYQRHWKPLTLIARGLIIDVATGQVEALPLEKFFNLGEQITEQEVAVAKPEPFDALVKMDGSLGIGYRADGRLCWATRGSFTSTQSVVAQMLWAEFREAARLKGLPDPEELFFSEFPHITPLAEIIHPETRVVITYNFKGLVLLAARNRFTGEDLPYEALQHIAERTGMQLVERLPSSNVEAIIARAHLLKGDKEGFVLWWPGFRAKQKGKEYIRLHKVVSNITPRDLANYWLEGNVDALLVEVPEEHREEYEAQFLQMDRELMDSLERTEAIYRDAPSGDQRAFAKWVSTVEREARPTLYTRRFIEAPDYARRLARDTMAVLLENGRLEPLLQQLCAYPLADACTLFEQQIGQYLWETSRTTEARMPLGRILPRFPKLPRSVIGTTMEMLQPDLIVARMREYLAHPDQRNTCDGLTIEQVFANAVPPENRFDQHMKWVFSLPLPLRSFLDRWRESGRKETASKRARALLGAAIESETTAEVEDLLREPLRLATPVTPLLGGVLDTLTAAWQRIPLSAGPRAAMEWARKQPSGWPLAMLNRCWVTYRTQVGKNSLENSQPVLDDTEE